MSKSQDSSAAATALVHPLVVMNVAEHWTRLKVQHGAPQPVGFRFSSGGDFRCTDFYWESKSVETWR